MPLPPTKAGQGQILARGSATGHTSQKRPAPASEDEVLMPEITAATMLLKDNGHFFTEPPCMAGVPLKRIYPGDPYWDPEWLEVKDVIEPKLAKWNDKLHKGEEKNHKTKRTNANQKVNRGNTILRFCNEADFSPYQLVGKHLITKENIVQYDTLFRLVATLEELHKFRSLDVTPLQWVRQRICEVYADDAEHFNLRKTVAGFYHDPKLCQLRERNGFAHIGHPLRHKLLLKNDGYSSASGSPPPRPKKESRKAATATAGPAGSSSFAATKSAKETQDVVVDGYTSTDSSTKEPVHKDDFRIFQVRNKAFTSNEDLTQYWHWRNDRFEHQVLGQVQGKPSWGTYDHPVNFHLKMKDVEGICYAPNSLKVLISCVDDLEYMSMDGAEVLVRFKRENTKRRFLRFCERKGVMAVQVNELYVDHAWESTHLDSRPLLAAAMPTPDLTGMPTAEKAKGAKGR